MTRLGRRHFLRGAGSVALPLAASMRGFGAAALDDPAWPDPEGGTVLDNRLVLIGTELDTAGDDQHQVHYMTYWLAGGGGRIWSGIFDVDGRSDVDLYSTIGRAMGTGE